MIPSSSDQTRLDLSTVDVETDYECVENFEKLSGETDLTESFVPLGNEGDYQLVGRVLNLLFDDESPCEILLVDIEVGECPFTLDYKECKGVPLTVGDLVRFDVKGLSLWDEGY
ncbi:MAG: hypothetical protein ACM3UZ_11780 [Acidobacteriota bacterium]